MAKFTFGIAKSVQVQCKSGMVVDIVEDVSSNGKPIVIAEFDDGEKMVWPHPSVWQSYPFALEEGPLAVTAKWENKVFSIHEGLVNEDGEEVAPY